MADSPAAVPVPEYGVGRTTGSDTLSVVPGLPVTLMTIGITRVVFGYSGVSVTVAFEIPVSADTTPVPDTGVGYTTVEFGHNGVAASEIGEPIPVPTETGEGTTVAVTSTTLVSCILVVEALPLSDDGNPVPGSMVALNSPVIETAVGVGPT